MSVVEQHDWQPIEDIAQAVQAGSLRAIDLVEQALQRIEDHAEFNAVIATAADRARSRAATIDSAIAAGQAAGRLAGVPFIAKDNFLTFGTETTAASNMLKGFTAPYQATAIEKLEAEGAICVAKANLDAFAHGGSTENSDFGATKNPHNPAHVPGGSSGGSAAAVALRLAPFALGTDTGGSIRQPASFSGCVGYKPTYGLVSRSGVVAMASSLDVVGPMTRTVADARLVLDIIAGQDPLDATTIGRSSKNYTDASPVDSLQGLRVGIIKEYSGDGIQPSVAYQVQTTIDRMRAAGAIVQEVSIPSLAMALAAYYIICPAEVSSNLGRYDGQRFGFTAKDVQKLDDSYSRSRGQGFGKEAKRRIMIGTYVLSSGYYDAYYKQAQTVRTKLIREFEQAFVDFDVLVGPVSPTTAFRLGQNTDDPLRMYLTDIMTVAANLVGVPAISLPAGIAQDTGLPVGLQLMAPQRQDHALLAIAGQVEELAV